MKRLKKILLAATILGMGIVLAWPFRKNPPSETALPAESFESSSEFLALQQADRASVKEDSSVPREARSPVAAQMTSTAEVQPNEEVPSDGGFDIANHPIFGASPQGASTLSEAISSQQEEQPRRAVVVKKPATPIPSAEPAARPAYASVETLAPRQHTHREIVHVVQNGDTLEKLAERYLDDAGRALEIFDLNRDVLENPHLLPIHAELRIPVGSDYRWD